MAIYVKANDHIHQMVREVMAQYHPALAECEVKVGVLMVSPNEGSEKPPLTLRGYPCDATIRIVSYKDRVAGMMDTQMCIDSNAWDDKSHEERVALLDHELNHLTLAYDDEGNIKLDDACRPVLKMVKHDHEIGIFECIIRRHGEHAVDYQAAEGLMARMNELRHERTQATILEAEALVAEMKAEREAITPPTPEPAPAPEQPVAEAPPSPPPTAADHADVMATPMPPPDSGPYVTTPGALGTV